MANSPKYFYRKHNVKHATGFLSPTDMKKLKALAKSSDKSVTLYITRLLEKHIKEAEQRGELYKTNDKL